jgi:hypothetical protein
MIHTLAIANYRSLRDIVMPLGRMTVVRGRVYWINRRGTGLMPIRFKYNIYSAFFQYKNSQITIICCKPLTLL